MTKVSVEVWHKVHAEKAPDEVITTADARQALQDKGLVVIDRGIVWINRDLKDKIEPFDGDIFEHMRHKVCGDGVPLWGTIHHARVRNWLYLEPKNALI